MTFSTIGSSLRRSLSFLDLLQDWRRDLTVTYTTNTPSGSNYRVVWFVGATNNTDYVGGFLYLGSDADVNELFLEVGIGGSPGQRTTPVALTLGQTYLLSVRYDSSLQELSLWIDGSLHETLSIDLSTLAIPTTRELLGDDTFQTWSMLAISGEVTFQGLVELSHAPLASPFDVIDVVGGHNWQIYGLPFDMTASTSAKLPPRRTTVQL